MQSGFVINSFLWFYLHHLLFVHAIVHYYDIRFTRFYLFLPSDRLIAAIKCHPISCTKMTRARNISPANTRLCWRREFTYDHTKRAATIWDETQRMSERAESHVRNEKWYSFTLRVASGVDVECGKCSESSRMSRWRRRNRRRKIWCDNGKVND